MARRPRGAQWEQEQERECRRQKPPCLWARSSAKGWGSSGTRDDGGRSRRMSLLQGTHSLCCDTLVANMLPWDVGVTDLC